ncbi:hypothetical protein GCM10020369_08770 [Cryptosporangium minutisporangium]|uniref:Uncharacterized protein n=1 Tax=Cryptosporangium minutisporangium TaxID=113569 RepID=A0ABP6SSI0_9ACTN
MGDNITAGDGASIINRSSVSNSYNAATVTQRAEVQDALNVIHEAVLQSKSDAGHEAFQCLLTELDTSSPKPYRVRAAVDEIIRLVPAAASLVAATQTIISAISS